MSIVPHHAYSPWRRHFALLPVFTDQGIAWLRFVERRSSTLAYDGTSWTDWQYRAVTSAPMGASHG